MATNWLGLKNTYKAEAEAGQNPVLPGDEIDRLHNAFDSQVRLGIQESSFGIIWQPDRTSFEVTDEGGFAVGIKRGQAKLLHPAYGPARVELTTDLLLSPLAPESVLYVFVTLQATSENDSRATGKPFILVDESPTVEGGQPLAQVTTDENGITGIIDLRVPSQAQDVNITDQTAETVANDADEILVHDVSASSNRKMTRGNFLLGYVKNVMTSVGDLIYGATSGTPTRLPGNTTTTRKFLRQVGNGTASAAPAWDTVTSEDIADFATAARSAVNDRTGAPVADLTALRAVGEAERNDKQTRLVEGAGALYRFDAEGAGSDDDSGVIAPDAGTGRWFKISGGGTENAATLEGFDGAHYLDRANHTGTQAQSTVTGLETALAGKQGVVSVVSLVDAPTIELDTTGAQRLSFDVSSDGDRTLGIPANPTAGQTMRVCWRNTDAAPHSLTLTTTGTGCYRFTDQVTEVPEIGAGKWVLIGFSYDGTDQRWNVESLVSGASA